MKRNWKKLLENIKLGADTFTSVWPILKMVFMVAGTFFVAVMLVNTQKQDEMDNYIAMYNEYKTQAENTSKFADSLKTHITIAENNARAAESRAAVLGRQAASSRASTTELSERAAAIQGAVTDSIQLARELIPLKDSIITQQETTIVIQDKQIIELNTSITNKDTAILLLTTSRDSLQSVINNLPPAPKNPNRMFGIKLPSRKVSFIAGTLLGAITIGVVLK